MKKEKFIIGIDPGMKGGIALLSLETMKVHTVIRMPVIGDQFDYEEIRRFFEKYKNDVACVCIEKVGYMGKDTASSIATLCYHAGILYGMAYAIGFNVSVMAPSFWKAKIGLPVIGTKRCSKNETPEQKKARLRENAKLKKKAKGNSIVFAYEKHPELRNAQGQLTDGEAEAILIADCYIKLWHTGTGTEDERGI